MITLTANEFDALARSVTKYGLRAGRYFVFMEIDTIGRAVPSCFVGHWDYCFDSPTHPRERYGITEGMSDRAVYAINKRKKVAPTSPVTWSEFVTQMGIVCCPAPLCDVSAHDSSMMYDESRGTTDASELEKQSLA